MGIIAGQSFTDLKNTILSEITGNVDIIKALVMHNENFLDITPTSEEQLIIKDSEKLIRKRIFPYKNIDLANAEDEVYITSGFYNFEKKDRNFMDGTIKFYIIVPNSLEKTAYGSRYDFIADKLEELLSNTGIGVFEFRGRSDVEMPVNTFLCHLISFDIIDFHWKR